MSGTASDTVSDTGDGARPRTIGRRVARAAATAVAAGVLVAGAAGCEPRPPVPRPPTNTTTTTTVPAPTELTIAYTASRGGTAITYTLRCGGATPTVTPAVAGLDAGRACATVDARRTLLVEGPPPSGGCMMMIFGPQKARVRGHVSGAPVDRWFGRNDSCAERTWSQVVGLFPRP